MFVIWVVWVCLDDFVEKFDFVDGCFGVVGGRFDDFESDVFVGSGVF